jgi:hypothetical protein
MASPVKNRFNWRMFHGRGSGVQRKKKTPASLENSGEIMRIMAWFRANHGQVRHFLANFMKLK